MTTFWLAAGLALVVSVNLDFLFTTIGADARTILSMRVARILFKPLRWLSHRVSTTWPHRIAGPVVMAAVAAFWIVGLAIGWTLTFGAVPGAVLATDDAEAPNLLDLLAHAGHLFSTLGVGLTEPGNSAWYVVGVITAVNGMIVMTLGVSFILTTSQTVVQGRAFSSLARAIDPADPTSFDRLGIPLAQLCAALNSAPFALFYSSSEYAGQVPHQLAEFAGAAARSEAFARYRVFLGDLPGFAPDPALSDAEFVADLRDWARPYQLRPV